MKNAKKLLIAAIIAASAGALLAACGDEHTHDYEYTVTAFPTVAAKGKVTGVCKNAGCDRKDIEAELPVLDLDYTYFTSGETTDNGYSVNKRDGHDDYTVSCAISDGVVFGMPAYLLSGTYSFTSAPGDTLVFIDGYASGATYAVAASDDSGYVTDISIDGTAGHNTVSAPAFVIGGSADGFLLSAAPMMTLGKATDIDAGGVLAVEIAKAGTYVFSNASGTPFDFSKLGIGTGIKLTASGAELTGKLTASGDSTTYELAAGSYYILADSSLVASGSVKLEKYDDPTAGFEAKTLGEDINVASASMTKPGKYKIAVTEAGYYEFLSDDIEYVDIKVGDKFTKGFGGATELDLVYSYRWTDNVYALEAGKTYYIEVFSKGTFKLQKTTQPPDEDPNADKFVDFTGFTAEQQGVYTFSTKYTIKGDSKEWSVAGTITVAADKVTYQNNSDNKPFELTDVLLTDKDIYIAKTEKVTGLRFTFETDGSITVINDGFVPNSKGYKGTKEAS